MTSLSVGILPANLHEESQYDFFHHQLRHHHIRLPTHLTICRLSVSVAATTA
jgi:hypothetical protein